jgi:3-deoxy-7-phosphoheptulonate synthase
MVEVHPNPPKALSDGQQSLYPDQFGELMDQIRVISDAIGREIQSLAAAPVTKG